jgi:hypothetical protein
MFLEKGFPLERKWNNRKETKMARVYLSFLGTNDYLPLTTISIKRR